MPDIRHVSVNYDPEANGWWAESDDVPGLVTEAPTWEGLIERVVAVVPELMEANEPGVGTITLVFEGQFHAERQVLAAA
jgi:predicted RNase H-like HicB family nuclease